MDQPPPLPSQGENSHGQERAGAKASFQDRGTEDGEVDCLGGKDQSRLLRIRDSSFEP